MKNNPQCGAYWKSYILFNQLLCGCAHYWKYFCTSDLGEFFLIFLYSVSYNLVIYIALVVFGHKSGNISYRWQKRTQFCCRHIVADTIVPVPPHMQHLTPNLCLRSEKTFLIPSVTVCVCYKCFLLCVLT